MTLEQIQQAASDVATEALTHSMGLGGRSTAEELERLARAVSDLAEHLVVQQFPHDVLDVLDGYVMALARGGALTALPMAQPDFVELARETGLPDTARKLAAAPMFLVDEKGESGVVELTVEGFPPPIKTWEGDKLRDARRRNR